MHLSTNILSSAMDTFDADCPAHLALGPDCMQVNILALDMSKHLYLPSYNVMARAMATVLDDLQL